MDAYTSFASVYDTFMDNIPYEEWAEYVIGLLKEYGILCASQYLLASQALVGIANISSYVTPASANTVVSVTLVGLITVESVLLSSIVKFKNLANSFFLSKFATFTVVWFGPQSIETDFLLG